MDMGYEESPVSAMPSGQELLCIIFQLTVSYVPSGMGFLSRLFKTDGLCCTFGYGVSARLLKMSGAAVPSGPELLSMKYWDGMG